MSERCYRHPLPGEVFVLGVLGTERIEKGLVSHCVVSVIEHLLCTLEPSLYY